MLYDKQPKTLYAPSCAYKKMTSFFLAALPPPLSSVWHNQKTLCFTGNKNKDADSLNRGESCFLQKYASTELRR